MSIKRRVPINLYFGHKYSGPIIPLTKFWLNGADLVVPWAHSEQVMDDYNA